MYFCLIPILGYKSALIRPLGLSLIQPYTGKKRFEIFLSPAGMSLTKLSLAGNNLIIPAQGEFG
jgi:hypothetical protein